MRIYLRVIFLVSLLLPSSSMFAGADADLSEVASIRGDGAEYSLAFLTPNPLPQSSRPIIKVTEMCSNEIGGKKCSSGVCCTGMGSAGFCCSSQSSCDYTYFRCK